MLKEWSALPEFDPHMLRTLERLRLSHHMGLLVVSLEPGLPQDGRTIQLPPTHFLMEPRLARKIGEHLIAGADFLEGTGDAN